MISSPFSSRRLLTALASILVVTAFILVGLNAFQLERRLRATATENYVKGYLSARKTYAAICPTPGRETNQFFATVASSDTRSLVLTPLTLDTDPLVDGVPIQRTVNITPSTVIQHVVQKSADEFNRELAEFAKTKTATTTPPSLVRYQSIRLSDIKFGDRVYVHAGEDIRLKPAFDATLIRVVE